MARINKWIYSWKLYIKRYDEWEFERTMHSHKEYKAIREAVVNSIHQFKFTEHRGSNPEYEEKKWNIYF